MNAIAGGMLSQDSTSHMNFLFQLVELINSVCEYLAGISLKRKLNWNKSVKILEAY
jgi:hypothetical protein